MLRSLRLLACSLGLLVWCASAGAATVGPPTATGSWVARMVIDAPAYSQPGDGRMIARVRARTPWSQFTTQLMVADQATAADGTKWIKVLLARKPNGSFGWIKADDAKLSHTPWRIEVDLSARRLSVFRAGHKVRTARAVVGAKGTPTPTGQFAIREIVKQPDPSGFSGPYIMHLNANSEKLKSFDGGDGVIGIHGRGGLSLLDKLGTAKSHGCVRIDNNVVRYLARHVVAGTPVLIVR